MTYPRRNTLVHEVGHAVLLASCQHPTLILDEIHVEASATAAGGCVMAAWWTARVGDWPAWFYPGPDRAGDAALALMAFGGMAAEIVLTGVRPNRGWNDDLFSAVLHLGLLGGVARHVVEDIAGRLDGAADGDLADVTGEVFRGLRVELLDISGANIGDALLALEQEAIARITASSSAITVLAHHLDRGRLSGGEVTRLLAGADWCGATGVPDIAGFFSSGAAEVGAKDAQRGEPR